MESDFTAKGVVSGVPNAIGEFSTTFAIGQIGRKLTFQKLTQTRSANTEAGTETLMNALIATNSEASHGWANKPFPVVISDRDSHGSGRKLRA